MQTRNTKRKLAPSESSAPVAKKAALPTKETYNEFTWIGQSRSYIWLPEMTANFWATTYDAKWEKPKTSRATFAWRVQFRSSNFPSTVRLFLRNVLERHHVSNANRYMLTAHGSCWNYDGDLPMALAGTAQLALRMFAPEGCSYAYVHFRCGSEKTWSDVYVKALSMCGFELLEQYDEPINDKTFERHMVFGFKKMVPNVIGPTISVGAIQKARLLAKMPTGNIEISTENIIVDVELRSQTGNPCGNVMFAVQNDDNNMPCISLDGMEIDPFMRGKHVASKFLRHAFGKTLYVLSTLGIVPRKVYAPLYTRYPIEAQRACLSGITRHGFKLTEGGDYTGEVPHGGFPKHFFDPDDDDPHDDTCLEFEK